MLLQQEFGQPDDVLPRPRNGGAYSVATFSR
jgi:hypothetical protein